MDINLKELQDKYILINDTGTLTKSQIIAITLAKIEQEHKE